MSAGSRLVRLQGWNVGGEVGGEAERGRGHRWWENGKSTPYAEPGWGLKNIPLSFFIYFILLFRI